MERWMHLLNSVAAGIVGACLTGALIGVVEGIYTLATGPKSGAAVLGVLWAAGVSTMIGGAIGAIPGALVMSLSRARGRPWASLPSVLIGTTAGFFLLSFPLALALQRPEVPPYVAFDVSWIGPTIGGIVATMFLPRSDRVASAANGV